MICKRLPHLVTLDAYKSAGISGSLEVLNVIKDTGLVPDGTLTVEAARIGHMDMIKHLHSLGHWAPFSRNTMNAAAQEGHIDIVKYLMENRTEGCSNALDYAVDKGHLDVVRYLVDHDVKCTTRSYCALAATGDLETLNLLHRGNCLRDTYTIPCSKTFDQAVSKGNMDMIKYLLDNKIGEASTRTWSEAAAGNHMEVIKFLAKKKIGKAFDAWFSCATNGHFEILQYLVRAKLVSSITTEQAASVLASNHLECIDYLDKHFPSIFTRAALIRAIQETKDILKLIEYMISRKLTIPFNGFPAFSITSLPVYSLLYEKCSYVFSRTFDMVSFTASKGKLDIIQYMHANDKLTDFSDEHVAQSIPAAAHHGHLDVIKYLHEKMGVRVLPHSIVEAAVSGDLATFRYIFDRVDFVDAQALVNASQGGHHAIVDFILTNPKSTPMPLVDISGASMRHVGILEMLLDHGMTLNSQALNHAVASNFMASVSLYITRMDLYIDSSRYDLFNSAIILKLYEMTYLLFSRLAQPVSASLTPILSSALSSLPDPDHPLALYVAHQIKNIQIS
eukprot:gene18217-21786_t